jgi:imidazolonepropionase-like amidohydrolase
VARPDGIYGGFAPSHAPIVAGTDGSGFEIVRELELYVEAGLTMAEALQAATINPARLVNVAASTGSVVVKKKQTWC